jgi:hypothetical protein
VCVLRGATKIYGYKMSGRVKRSVGLGGGGWLLVLYTCSWGLGFGVGNLNKITRTWMGKQKSEAPRCCSMRYQKRDLPAPADVAFQSRQIIVRSRAFARRNRFDRFGNKIFPPQNCTHGFPTINFTRLLARTARGSFSKHKFFHH